MRASKQVPAFLNIEDASTRLGVSDKTVRRWIWSGELHHHRLGSVIRISEDDLAAYLAARRK